ncbi:MAG: two-component system, chemotaxis family, CheB/CheR fusion protein [Candidatus Sumerlaeota bacterium]|nr:two-component system, chemotaxis family, CheB/CheR fusion protein [Candidatus Sumerlaeota bacterium]
MQESFEQQCDFRFLLDIAEGLLLGIDGGGIVRLVNRAGCGLLEGAEEEITGRACLDTFVSDEDRDAFAALLAGTESPGPEGAAHREIAIRTLKGNRRVLAWRRGALPAGGVLLAGRDITGEKEALERLTRAERLLKHVGRLGRIGGWEFNPETRLVDWTDEVYHIYGLPVGTPINIDNSLMYYQPAGRELVARAVRSAIEEGKGFDVEAPFENARGERLWVHAVGSPLISEGRVVRVWGTFQDTTRRRQFEETLRDRETQLARIEEISRIATWTWDIEDDIMEGSEQFYRLLGRDARTLLLDHETFLKIIHPDDREETALLIGQTLEANTPYSNEHRVVLPDGTVRWLHCEGRLTLSASGKPKRLFGTTQDVTDRVIRETERVNYLERVHRQQAALLEIASAGAHGTEEFEDIAGMIAAKAARTLNTERVNVWKLDEAKSSLVCLVHYDLTRDEMGTEDSIEASACPKYFETFKTERSLAVTNTLTDERFSELLDGYLRPRGIGALLDAPIRLDGRLAGMVCFEHVGGPRHWHTDEVDFAADIAEQLALALNRCERRRLEAQVLQSQKLESLGVLAGGIAHDFNNMLMAITGNADLAMQDVEKGHPARECLEDIEVTAQRAAGLCKQMLAYSGKGRFEVQHLDLSDLVREMRGMLDVSLSKKARVQYELASDLPAISADATQVCQVIMNLAVNASEALMDAPGMITFRTYCFSGNAQESAPLDFDGAPVSGPHVCLEVRDTGCGMDEDTRKRLFDPFFTTKFTGRGLGLAAVLGIVRGHSGAIEVASEPGQGTTIRVCFPARGAHTCTPPPVHRDMGGWRGSGTVLLVDDEQIVRTVGSRMLERLGFKVLTAEDGVHAMEVFHAHADEIVLVLLDLTMPRRDGEETFRELRLVAPGVRILMSSGYNEQELIQRFSGQKLVGFIQKPYVLMRLRDKIQAVMEEG